MMRRKVEYFYGIDFIVDGERQGERVIAKLYTDVQHNLNRFEKEDLHKFEGKDVQAVIYDTAITYRDEGDYEWKEFEKREKVYKQVSMKKS